VQRAFATNGRAAMRNRGTPRPKRQQVTREPSNRASLMARPSWSRSADGFSDGKLDRLDPFQLTPFRARPESSVLGTRKARGSVQPSAPMSQANAKNSRLSAKRRLCSFHLFRDHR
jgi:hypothetical protein